MTKEEQVLLIENEINEVLRNIEIRPIDVVEYGTFTKEFYNRDDISNEKKEIIKELQKKLFTTL